MGVHLSLHASSRSDLILLVLEVEPILPASMIMFVWMNNEMEPNFVWKLSIQTITESVTLPLFTLSERMSSVIFQFKSI